MTKAFLDPPRSRFSTDPAHTPETVTNHNCRNLIAERGIPPYSFGTYSRGRWSILRYLPNRGFRDLSEAEKGPWPGAWRTLPLRTNIDRQIGCSSSLPCNKTGRQTEEEWQCWSMVATGPSTHKSSRSLQSLLQKSASHPVMPCSSRLTATPAPGTKNGTWVCGRMAVLVDDGGDRAKHAQAERLCNRSCKSLFHFPSCHASGNKIGTEACAGG